MNLRASLHLPLLHTLVGITRVTHWSNDGTSSAGSKPAKAVSLKRQ